MLKFFQLYPDPANEDAHRVVLNVIRKVVAHSSDVAKAPYRQINAYNAVLFECISLVLVFQDKELMKSSSIVCDAESNGEFLQIFSCSASFDLRFFRFRSDVLYRFLLFVSSHV